MKIRTALLAATVLSLPVAVNAQAIKGVYISGGAGINLMQDPSYSITAGDGEGVSSNLRTQNSMGFVGVGAIGYGLGNGIRLEVEGNYRQNNFGSTTSFTTSAHGSEQKAGVMVNGLYDIPVAFPITPYVGGGVGYSWESVKGLNVYQPGVFSSYTNGTEGAFAYQAIVGGAYAIKSVPGLAVTAEYRFMGLEGNRSYSNTVSPRGAPDPTGTFKLSDEYNHSLLIGLRYAFGAPAMTAPMAMTPPPAAISKNYLVFFDWDKADLTARAKEIIAEAAANTKKVAVTKIAVNGYTDLSGTAAYNQGLSVRRAKAVAAELVKDGVPAKEIGIQGFGETNPLVPTAKGVREPQNRRVEIIFQ